ncbi:MAG TPA: GGDEF domain-containing protein [Thermoanaerobaculia bacterium]|nr:GGDEF domain-containing protein [Thermoanaerobaculia bacterium]
MASRRDRTPGHRERALQPGRLGAALARSAGSAEPPASLTDAEQTVSEDFVAVDPSRYGDQGDVELIVIAHPDLEAVGTRFRVPRQPSVAIGRAEAADLRLAGSSSLSRLHARLRFAAGRITIEDAGSRNGTFVNGRRIAGAVELASGDRVQVGGVHCKLLRELDVEAAYHDALLELAVRDGLTGAFNRRFFHDELEREIARSRRHAHPFTLIVVDADDFKAVNDCHGHVVGDQVLREIANVLGESVRSEQVLARVGGDEFAILCPETCAAEAGALAQRLCAALAARSMPCLAGGETVTCSFGVAELAEGDGAATDLYEKADRALYRSKSEGRTRVTVAPTDS